VIGEEGQPTLAWITAALDTLQIPGYGSFGNDEAQFLKFSMDPGCSPGRILFGQVSDEPPNFSRSFRSAGACSRLPLPEEPKSLPVPPDNGLRLYRNQDLGPPGPYAVQGHPEQPIQPIQPRTWPFPLEKDELLPQGEDLQGGVIPTAEENSNSGQESEDELEHELYFVARLASSSKVDSAATRESQVADCRT
jgi:hypothetical protein